MILQNKILTQMFILFKGKPGGRIERDFANYPPGASYCVQNNAWMDEEAMKKWVDRVLKPYVQMV